MRGRKLLSAALAAALSLCLAAPALAEGSDQALMAVTAKVKTTLGLDTEVFTDFQGWADEDVLLGKRWSLEWSGDGVGLSITADDRGKIYAYNYRESVSDEPVVYRGMGGRLNIPQLPEDKSDSAFAAAQDFVNTVLESPTETAQLSNGYTPSLYQDTYRYSGKVKLNGLDSPVDCSVSVRASDLKVLRFWRGDQYAGYVGGVPSPATALTEAQARTLLRPTVKMEARYVLEEDGKTAKVRYLPAAGDDYYVDAASGQLVNLTELRQKLWRGDYDSANKVMFTEAAADMAAVAEAPAAGLTQAEKEGAAILTGALSKEELDKALKAAWPEMGLEGYTLSSASYSVYKKDLPQGTEAAPEDYDVSCRLVYSQQQGQTIRYKYAGVDAKTGELKSLSSRRSYRGEETERYAIQTGLSGAQAKAETALKAFAGDHALVVALQDTGEAVADKNWEHRFFYQHTAGGFFYPGNSYTVGIDGTDGTLSYLEGYFDDEVVLEVPQSVIGADKAADIYLAAMAVPYRYLEVPVAISAAGDDLAPLLKEAGHSYVNALKTGYVLTQPEDRYIQGVYAQTGEVVSRKDEMGEVYHITYDDLEGHWVQAAAQALAVFDIGLPGGSMKPADTLTQLDMVTLLSSVDGYLYDPGQGNAKEALDQLYQHAYALGLVTPETRDETRAITRGELVRLILDGAGYGRIAALPGIFRCDFADADAISAQELGYAALAQGLGLVKGGSDGSYAAQRPITRAEAVAMLYQYMK